MHIAVNFQTKLGNNCIQIHDQIRYYIVVIGSFILFYRISCRERETEVRGSILNLGYQTRYLSNGDLDRLFFSVGYHAERG